MRQWTGSALFNLMASPAVGAKAFTWTIVDLLSIGSLRTNFAEMLIKKYEHFFQDNAFENLGVHNVDH